jgi:TolA-binding protein
LKQRNGVVQEGPLVRYRRLAPLVVVCALTALLAVQSQTPPPAKGPEKASNDLELVEKLLVARREYQKALETLRMHYWKAGDVEKSKWAEEELRQYHRISKQAFRLDLDVPPPNLPGNVNVPEANALYMRAVGYKDHGFGTDFIDNQRRTEILLQQLLTQYPQSDKISDAAFMLGDVYDEVRLWSCVSSLQDH